MLCAYKGGYSARNALLRNKYYPYFYDDTYLSGSRAALLASSRLGSPYLYGSSRALTYDLVHYQALARKNAEIEELNLRYESSLSDLEEQLKDSKSEVSSLKKE